MIPQEAGFPEPNQRPPADRSEPNPVAGRIEAALRDGYSPAPALSSTPSVGDLLRALRRRWMAAIALGGTLAGIAAVAVWYLMTPDYTAFAQIRVSSKQPDIGGWSEDHNGGQASFLTYMRAQATQFKSQTVIKAALKRDDMKRLNLEANYSNPVFYIDEKLKVETLDGSEFMTPRMTCSDPNEATTIIKAMTAAYMDEIVYAEQRTRVAHHAQLEKAYHEAAATLDAKKASLEQNAKQLGLNPNETPTIMQMQVLENLHDRKLERYKTRTDLTTAQSLLDAHNAQIDAMKKTKLADVQIETAVKADPEAAALKADLDKCKSVIERYLTDAREPEKEPTYHAALRRKADLEQRYNKRRDEVKKDLLARFDEKMIDDHDLTRIQLGMAIGKMKENLADLDKDIAELTAKWEKFPVKSTEIEAQRAEIDLLAKVVADLGEKKEKLNVELAAPQRITVYQEAELEKRDMKKQIAATAAAPIAVFFLTCMGLAWVEYRQRRIQSAGEVAHGLGIRVVGSIPNQANLERCLVGAGESDLAGQPVLESIDAIRTLLLYQAQTASTRVVMVTSAAEGEAKTTLASHLAGSLARAGRKTLLIDADLRQPAVHQLFETPLQPGFSEVLLGEVEVADSIQATTIDGLSIIAAGQWDREVIQSLARGGMEGVFEKLREEFDFIIVDSHPVLSATDALLIGQHVDAVLLSVLKQVSQMPRVYTACHRLAALNIRVLGAVVNGTDPEEVFTAPNYTAAVEQV